MQRDLISPNVGLLKTDILQQKDMRNIKFFSLALFAALSTCVFAQTTNIGTYSTQDISADGSTSTWAFILPSSQVTIPATGATDNGIVYEPSGSSKMKFSSSNQFSWQGQSSGYIPVPAGGAGTISMTTKGQSDKRYLQLYINGTEAAETKRLYSKASSDGNITSDGKKGPQSFSFTASDLTTKDGNTYLHFKDNNTEMKIATFTITLTTGSYSEGGGGGGEQTDVPVTGVALNKSATTIQVGASETLTVSIIPSNATNQNVTWSTSNSAIATVNNGVVTAVAAGTATITVKSVADNTKTATCTITVPTPSSDPVAVTSIELNTYATSLNVGGTVTLTATVKPTNATNQNVTWSSSDNSIATVANGVVTAVAAGTVTITATSVSDPGVSIGCTVAVTAAPSPDVPQTGLTTHVPEVYEAKEIAGGYGGTLSVYNSREYEVYYAGRSASNSIAALRVSPVDKKTGIEDQATATSTYLKIRDGWGEVNTASVSNSSMPAATAEFLAPADVYKTDKDKALYIHVQGYDEFAIYAADKNVEMKDGAFKKNQRFQIFIDDVMQPETQASTNATVRRYTITTGRHVIQVKALSDGQSLLYGFSLRVANEPRTKYLKGNDSSQVVLQTTSIKPIVYTTKYNNIPGAETRLEWMGAEANGITLTKVVGTLSDTLTIGGAANCPTGTYQYAVVAYYNGVETNRATGTFRVASDIQATSDIDVDAFQNEEMDQITFRYYALSANDVLLTWPNGQPSGISGSGNNGKYIIGGTPNITGPFPKVFPFAITVTGADTVIEGKITVKDSDYGPNAVLYLYKNNKAYEHDGVYKYLNGTGTGKYHLIERKAKMDGLRPADQYANYKWILISEDVDADNPEILALARGEGDLPVLSMKSFSYTPGRLNWGEPNNGSLTYEEGRFITVVRDDHPIFKALNKKKGDRILVLNEIENKGLMPVAVNYQGTLCLATARTRDIENYDADGPEETFLHEVPAEIHRNHKYLCLPISMDASNHLHNDGKKLIDECVKYILSSSASIKLPDLAITEFKIGSYTGRIDDNENRIVIEVPAEDSTAMHAVTPEITLASPLTHVTPKWINADGTIDFSNWSFGVPHTVSDYINVRTYDVIVRLTYPQGIEAVEANEWINIFDVYGRKVATTNEDYRTMDLPKGMYIIVTESGQTIKIMR